MRISTGGRRQLAGGKARASFKLQNLLGSDWVAFLPDQNSTSGIPLVAEFALKGSFGASEGMSESGCLVKTGGNRRERRLFQGSLLWNCHSDLHMVRMNEWGTSTYPLVPGHEIVGVVTEVGSKVEKFKLASGLGHMAVKFAKGMGVKVTVISTSPSKKQEAVEHLGADSFLVSRDQDQMKATMGTMDGIIDTVSATHPLVPLIGLLKTNGKLILVGAPEKPLELAAFPLLMGRKMVGGSGIGGMEETQEMINFAAKHNITADIEVIPIEYVNTAMERMLKADVRYRFVIDISNTIKSTH
ncbi:hypothetical protein GH714_014713 [Hevea brasiliensis]|uniref:Alcohol dehydrogenase-like C-terminal domain-containing protein n=1 Tax=Hevea brasiliensis TaxID=3981 RepID=A0A6A6KPL6_HEVBR|nr:hypothetical protein GH714_014713 [Hevea brasiliensis]